MYWQDSEFHQHKLRILVVILVVVDVVVFVELCLVRILLLFVLLDFAADFFVWYNIVTCEFENLSRRTENLSKLFVVVRDLGVEDFAVKMSKKVPKKKKRGQ